MRTARALCALAVLLVAYQVYATVAVPLIEPEPGTTASQSLAEQPVVAAAHPELAALFPEGAWERERPMVLTTQWGKLLFKEYRPSDDGRLELVPCTIVVYVPTRNSNGKTERRAILLQAPDKAVLSFAGPLNLARAEFTKLQGARLEGAVRVSSRETAPGANDALLIETRNVQILPQQIWTAHDVTFSYGPHHGSGRDLSIALSATNETGKAKGGDALARHLETLELSHLDQLVLHVPARSLLGSVTQGPTTPAQPASLASASPSSNEVHVTCQGPFRFDFQKSLASLEDRVDIVRNNVDGPSDQLNCDRLHITFRQPADKKTPTGAGAVSPTAGAAGVAASPFERDSVGKLSIQRIEARGFPVTLQAPSVGLSARGQHLSYDFDTRRILLTDEQNALLVYRQHRTEAPRLEYELHTDPQRLGRLWAAGPGSYQGQFGDSPDQLLTATWCGVLEMQPRDGLHVLSVVQGADFRWKGTGKFAADELYVWLSEVPVERPVTTSMSTAAQASGNAGGQVELAPAQSESSARDALAVPPAPTRVKWDVRPVKMLAQGNVIADAKQFRGNTPRLEVWFDQPDAPADVMAATSNGDPTQPGPQSAPQGLPLQLPSDKEGDSDKKLELNGDWIRLRLLMTQPRPKVREATIVGNVQLGQSTTGPGPQPLRITGEMLQLRTDPLDRSTVDVSGAPARVQVQGLLLEGSSLHLSQRENRLWAAGAGKMKLPARERPPGQPSPSSTPLESLNTPIWVSWQGGMEFDGQQTTFEKQVEVRGIQTTKQGERMHMVAVGEKLQVHFNRYVAFEKQPRRDDLDVVAVRFLGEVFTENQTYNAQEVMTSHDRMMMRDMVLDRTTGKFSAMGPGWIVSTRVDQSGKGGLLPGSPAPPPASPGAPSSGRLVYLRVDFQNGIEGNLETQEAVFQNFVRAVYSPVQEWGQTVDPDRPGGLGPQGIVLTSQQLWITETTAAGQPGIELSAVGNVLVEGAEFTARAQRLTYIQAKQLLILDGENGAAQLQQQMRQGQRPNTFVGKKIMYWIATGQCEVEGAQQLDFSHIGAQEMPQARLR